MQGLVHWKVSPSIVCNFDGIFKGQLHIICWLVKQTTCSRNSKQKIFIKTFLGIFRFLCFFAALSLEQIQTYFDDITIWEDILSEYGEKQKRHKCSHLLDSHEKLQNKLLTVLFPSRQLLHNLRQKFWRKNFSRWSKIIFRAKVII